MEQLTDDQLDQQTNLDYDSEEGYRPDFIRKLPASDRSAYRANVDNAMEMSRGSDLDQYLDMLNKAARVQLQAIEDKAYKNYNVTQKQEEKKENKKKLKQKKKQKKK